MYQRIQQRMYQHGLHVNHIKSSFTCAMNATNATQRKQNNRIVHMFTQQCCAYGCEHDLPHSILLWLLCIAYFLALASSNFITLIKKENSNSCKIVVFNSATVACVQSKVHKSDDRLLAFLCHKPFIQYSSRSRMNSNSFKSILHCMYLLCI